MAETANIGEIAVAISKDIFQPFRWRYHPLRDTNFKCHDETHMGTHDKQKSTHPGDVVFYYNDPYLGKVVYLHTDLKSYGKKSISASKLRQAFKSLCMTIECATASSSWREKYSIDESEPHQIRGLLFVHNHDNKFSSSFSEVIKTLDLHQLPLTSGSALHFLGPDDIQRLYSISNDIVRLKGLNELSDKYTFYYPDLVITRRQGDVWNQTATIESLTGPFLIIKHERISDDLGAGYLIYYNRNGDQAEEFEYFLDCLSRFQILESGQSIRIRLTTPTVNPEFKSVFEKAKRKYVKAWGFASSREAIIEAISVDRITAVTNTYNPGAIGWHP